MALVGAGELLFLAQETFRSLPRKFLILRHVPRWNRINNDAHVSTQS